MKPLEQLVGGRFRLLQVVASGAMGQIFKALDSQTGQVVALKQLTLDDPDSVARFAREATTLAAIHHPGVVGYISHGHIGNESYLVMNWVDGESLSARVSREGLTIDDAVAIGVQIADALNALHQQGLVHRDVKPSNIMVPSHAVTPAMLVDFGLVRDLTPVEPLTRTGTAVGSPSYMSPEQALGAKSYTPASDVYSLACTMYLLVTGIKAFPGEFRAAVEAKILAIEPPSPHQLNPEVPKLLSSVIQRGMARDPAARPSDGAEFAKLLLGCAPTRSSTRMKSRSVPPPRASPVGPSRVESGSTIEAVPPTLHFAVAVDSPSEEPEQTAQQMAEIKRVSGECDANDARLRDGTIIMVSKFNVEPDRRVANGVRCALQTAQTLPGHAVALAIDAESAEQAVDRAMRLVASEHMARQVLGSTSMDIRTDRLSSYFLESSYALRSENGAVYLIGLVGNPTP